MKTDYPYIEDFCDDTVYVFSTIGQGPKGDKGDRGDVTAPIFADPIEWDINLEYEDLSVVLHNGDSYTAKKAVPAGIDIHNKNYWALTANFNAQLQTCRDEIAQVGSDLASEREARALADDAEMQARIAEDAAIREDLSELIESSSIVSCETGMVEGKSIYSIISFKKSKIRVDLQPVSLEGATEGSPLVTSMSVRDYAIANKPLLVCNINPTNNVIYNGELYGNDWRVVTGGTTGMYGTTENGEMICQSNGMFSNMIALGAVAAIGAWQPLVVDGVVNPISSYATFSTPNPWQIFGEDDERYYLFSSYCRFNDFDGWTLEEARNFVLPRGWRNMYAFDGGGSVQVWGGNPLTNHSLLLDANRMYREQYMVLVFSERG